MRRLAFVLLGCALQARAMAFSPPAWSAGQPIYEVNLDTFGSPGTYAALEQRLPELKALGVGIVWLMPIYTRGVLKAFGSPYCVRDFQGFYAPYGSADDLKRLVRTAHGLGLHVILDWVGNHSSWDNALIKEHPEFYKKDDKGEIAQAYSWGDAAQLDYGNVRLRLWMIAAMRHWLQDYDIDGFRCDAAWAVPVDFWIQARHELEKVKPVFLLAEADDPKDQSAFDADYDWSLMSTSKINRLTDIAQGTRPVSLIGDLVAQDSLRFSPGFKRMRFTSNHDEWKDHGTPLERFGAGAKAFAVLTATLPGVPLVYNGQEVGWDHKDGPISWAPSPTAASYRALYTTLLHAYQNHPALNAGLWRPIKTDAADSVCAYLRQSGDDKMLVILNLSPRKASFQLDDPSLTGDYTEIFSGARCRLGASVKTAFNPWEYRVLAGKADPKVKVSDLPQPFEKPIESVAAACSGDWVPVARVVQGQLVDASAAYKVHWSPDYLYVSVKVQKKNLIHAAPNETPWNDDSVEVYLAMKHDHSIPAGGDDYHFIVGYQNPHLFEAQGRTAGVQFSSPLLPDGYDVEMAIPWKLLGAQPVEKAVYGFDVAVNLAYTPGSRGAAIAWSGDDQDYRDTSLFGDLTLGAACN